MRARVLVEVLRHELTDALRDRRMVALSLLMLSMMSVLNLANERVVRSRMQERRDVALTIAVRHPDRAPNLIAWLEGHEVDVVRLPADADQALRDQRLDVVLEIDKDYGVDWREGRPARVRIASDQSNVRAREAAGRLEALLSAYSGQLGALRLTLRGVAPEVATPLVIGQRDVAPAQASEPVGILLLPCLLLMSGLLGVSLVAVDFTAGERERQTIEALLVTAAPREQIMLGKILAASAFGVATLAAQGVMLLGAGSLLKSDAFQASPAALTKVVLTVSPIVVLVGTAMTCIAAFSKSVRESQTALSPVIVAPLAPLFYLVAAQPRPTLGLYATPLLGQYQLSMDLLRGDAVSPLHVAVNLATTLALLLPAVWVGSRLYRREALAISA